MLDRPTRLFLRWRDRGDAAALAELFDRTAPELLRLALHLCRHAVDAEDVLQATFLAAIESAQHFERGQRVMPWLTGILTHRALAEHRRRQRMPVAATDGEREGGDAEPFQHAQSSELQASTRAAIDRLREPYRQPTMLRLVHGMEPAEIALVLQRSPGTVRAQLHRGLEQLRRLLPAGIATSLAVGAFAGRGMAAVKQAVLAASRAHVVAASAATTSGFIAGMLMGKKLVVGAGAVLAALTFCAWWLADTNAEVADRLATTAVVARALESPVPGPTPTNAPEVASSAATTERSLVHANTTATWPLRIQVVDGVTETPIAGARVSLTGPRRMTLFELQRELGPAAAPQRHGVPSSFGSPWEITELPAEVLAGTAAHDFLLPPTATTARFAVATTDGAGWFELAAPTSGAMLTAAQDGYGTRFTTIAKQPPAEQRILLWRTRRVTGQLRMEDESRLPGPIPIALDATEGTWCTTTDARGHFSIEIAAPQARVTCLQHGLVVTDRILGPNGEAWVGNEERRFQGPETFFLARFASTRLHVFDAATKQPIEHIHVWSQDPSGFTGQCGAFLAPNGYFALTPGDLQRQLHDAPSLADHVDRVFSTVRVWSAGHRACELRDVRLRGGDDTIDVALEPGKADAFSGTVVRAGQPLHGMRVRLCPHSRLQWQGSLWMAIGGTTTSSDGEFTFEVPNGDYVLEVRDGQQLVAQQHVTSPPPTPLQVDLDAAVWVDVLVVDADSRPSPVHNVFVRGANGQNHEGKTDATGHALLGPFEPGTLEAMAPRQAKGYFHDGGVTETFTAASGVRAALRLQPAAKRLVRATLMFHGAPPASGFTGFSARDWHMEQDVAVAADGTVPIDLTPEDSMLIVNGPGQRQWRFQIPANARTTHTILLPWQGLAYAGTLRTTDGVALAAVRIEAIPIRGGNTSSVHTAADGSFRLDGLAPTRHWLQFHADEGRGPYGQQRFVTTTPPAATAVALEPRLERATDARPLGYATRSLHGRIAASAGALTPAWVGIVALLQQEGGVLEISPLPTMQKIEPDGSYRQTIASGPRHRIRFWRNRDEQPVHEEEFTLPIDANDIERDFVLR